MSLVGAAALLVGMLIGYVLGRMDRDAPLPVASALSEDLRTWARRIIGVTVSGTEGLSPASLKYLMRSAADEIERAPTDLQEETP